MVCTILQFRESNNIRLSGLKTVSLRIRGTEAAKNELEAAGEDTEGMVTSVSKLRDLIMDLTKVKANNFKGFDILTNSGDYKDTYDILLGIAKIWEDIGKGQQGDLRQANILESLAGKNRANVIASVLQNPDLLEKGYTTALNSEGSAAKENEAVLNSISGKVQIFKSTLEEMWNHTIDSNLMKSIVDLGTSIVDVVDKVGMLNIALVGLSSFAGAKGLGERNYQLLSY